MRRIAGPLCIIITLEGHIYITIYSMMFFLRVHIFVLYLGKLGENRAICDCTRRNNYVFHREGLFLAPPMSNRVNGVSY